MCDTCPIGSEPAGKGRVLLAICQTGACCRDAVCPILCLGTFHSAFQICHHGGTDANLPGDGQTLATSYGMRCCLPITTLNRSHGRSTTVLRTALHCLTLTGSTDLETGDFEFHEVGSFPIQVQYTGSGTVPKNCAASPTVTPGRKNQAKLYWVWLRLSAASHVS